MLREGLAALAMGLVLSPASAGAQAFCVTSGAIARTAEGAYRVESASLRAVVDGSDGSTATLRFRDLGPSAQTRALASGALRRQIGLKLHARDACNLVYAMWRMAPENRIVVSVKLNPGQTRSAQCHADGYVNVAPAEAADPPTPKPGDWHVLRAAARGDELIVTVDGAQVWRGTLPAEARQLEGPAGLRSDNARFDFVLRAPPGAAASGDRCQAAPGD